MLAQVKAKGKGEYSSTIVNIKRFLVAEGNGPLKSKLSRSKGCVALILAQVVAYKKSV